MQNKKIRLQNRNIQQIPRSLAILLLVVLLAPLLLLAGIGALQEPEIECRSRVKPGYGLAALAARVLARQVKAIHGAPGMSIAAALDGEIVWSESFGYANIANLTPACPSTQFRLGSVSKPLTAAAALRLYEQGQLDLDAPVQQYVPAFPPTSPAITSRMLLAHLSGIRHYKKDEDVSITRHYNSLSDGLELFINDPLSTPPGSTFRYSSFGYNLLGIAIESAQGQPYLQAMQDLVFHPLGMYNTTTDDLTRTNGQRATPYEDELTGVGTPPYVDSSYKWPAGGMVSTPEDLVRFASGLMSGSLLQQETLEMMLTPQCPECRELSTRKDGYGLGLEVTRDWNGRRVALHDGHATGGTAGLRLYPDDNLALAIAMNIGTENTIEIKEQAMHTGLAWIAHIFLFSRWLQTNQIGILVFAPTLVLVFSYLSFRFSVAGKD